MKGAKYSHAPLAGSYWFGNAVIEGEITLAQVREKWDVVIIGAGPAGAFAAFLLSRFTDSILLVEKAKFPRAKVCGCCINNAAVELLATNSLRDLLVEQGAIPLSQLRLFDGNQRSTINLPGGFSLSRNRFDSSLVRAAIKSGVSFLPGCSANVFDICGDSRSVQLSDGQTFLNVDAKMVLVADGLGGRSLEKQHEFEFITEAKARFGCGTIIGDAPDFYISSQIYMACSNNGYVGLVRLEDGRIDVAAALDREFSRQSSGAGNAAASILRSCNLPIPNELANSNWTGTDGLTRKRKQIAGERLFVIGDACGYAEPFTGEGIAWALASAQGVVELAVKGLAAWSPSLIFEWETKHNRLLNSRQHLSSAIAHGLRNGNVRRCALSVASAFPNIASSIASYIANPPGTF